MNNNLTLVVVDTAFYSLAAKALDLGVKITGAKSVLVLSDKDFYPGSTFVKIDPITDKRGYSRIMLKELGKHITTDHFMVVQYDGMPVDETKWTDDFLKYDYIGAPWAWGPENRRVGNGGFSIRSRRLSDYCLEDAMVFDPPGYGDENFMEDTHICLLYRDWLESKGINFAPVSLARKFSAENPPGKYDTYGFHGTLCLPYYLDDEHLDFFINNMTPAQYNNDTGSRIIFGLYVAERWDHLESMIDRGCELIPQFKDKLISQLIKETNHFPNLTPASLESLLINY